MSDDLIARIDAELDDNGRYYLDDALAALIGPPGVPHDPANVARADAWVADAEPDGQFAYEAHWEAASQRRTESTEDETSDRTIVIHTMTGLRNEAGITTEGPYPATTLDLDTAPLAYWARLSERTPPTDFERRAGARLAELMNAGTFGVAAQGVISRVAHAGIRAAAALDEEIARTNALIANAARVPAHLLAHHPCTGCDNDHGIDDANDDWGPTGRHATRQERRLNWAYDGRQRRIDEARDHAKNQAMRHTARRALRRARRNPAPRQSGPHVARVDALLRSQLDIEWEHQHFPSQAVVSIPRNNGRTALMSYFRAMGT